MTSWNVTSSAASDDVMASTWLRALLVSLYCVIFALGVSGNSLVVYVISTAASYWCAGRVVYVIWHDKSLQTTTNVFIANLAVSDIMMCLPVVTSSLADVTTRDVITS